VDLLIRIPKRGLWSDPWALIRHLPFDDAPFLGSAVDRIVGQAVDVGRLASGYVIADTANQAIVITNEGLSTISLNVSPRSAARVEDMTALLHRSRSQLLVWQQGPDCLGNRS
jgi:hypothetical protein